MRTLVADAARFARSISTAPGAREVWDQLKVLAAQGGFSDLVVLRRALDLPDSGRTTVLEGDATLNVAVSQSDFVRALNDLSPFSLSEARAERQIAAAVQIAGDGWVIPVLSPNARGIVVFAGSKPDMSPLLSSVLHLLAILAFARVEELLTGVSSNRHGLTAREIECLRWVARGKTDREIAEILSVSPRTARFHVENVKTKLNVETRVHAVAEAIRRQLIAA